MTPPPIPEFTAELVECSAELVECPASRAWYITHQLGSIAKGTFTRVQFAPGVDMTYASGVARRIAYDLYGSMWAFIYSPEHADRVFRHGLRIREAVRVTAVHIEEN